MAHLEARGQHLRRMGLDEMLGEMSEAQLVDRLAQQVLRWTVARDRFLLGNRGWIPRWKFSPCERLNDAVKLLDGAAPTSYAIIRTNGQFQVTVDVEGNVGRASGQSRPRTIVLALARSLGLEVRA